MKTTKEIEGRIRTLIILFIIALVLSGLTAFPLEIELHLLFKWSSNFLDSENSLHQWIKKVYEGVQETNQKYSFIAYGTDWLAFAHIVIAIAFIGPLKDPIRNIWVIHFGIIACILIFPLAIIAGPIRGIPFYWRVIDCSFGIIGLVPLLLANSWINKLIKLKTI